MSIPAGSDSEANDDEDLQYYVIPNLNADYMEG